MQLNKIYNEDCLQLNKIYNEDCLQGMKRIPDKSIDMVLTDPPYGTTACKWDAVIPFEPMWEELKRIIKSGGAIVLFGSEPFSTLLRASNIDWYKYDWIWKKPQGTGFLNAKKMPLKNYENISVFYQTFSDCYNTTGMFTELKEYMRTEREKTELNGKQIRELLGSNMGAHYFTNGAQFTIPTAEAYSKLQTTGFFDLPFSELKQKYETERQKSKTENFNTYNPQMSKGKPYVCKQGYIGEYLGPKNKSVVTINDGSRYPVTILEYSKEVGHHPTQKPVALLEYLIKTYTNEGETVLDFTIGSGSTAVACINTNRNFIGFEISKEYCDIANKRINGAVLSFNS